MAEMNSTTASILRVLEGPDGDRVRALEQLDSTARPIDEAVLARVLELAGEGEREGQGQGEGAAGTGDAAAPRTPPPVSKEIRRRVAAVLTHVCSNDEQRSRVLEGLGDAFAGRRWICAFALARAGYTNVAVLEVAVEALNDPDGDIRWAAAEILRAPESLAEAKPLIVSAAATAPAMRRKMALYCLRDLNIPEIEIILDALHSTDSGVRLAALAALPKLAVNEPRATSEVIVCMRTDSDVGVRRAAAAILGRLSGDVAAARSALEAESATSPDSHFRRAAAGALAKLRAG